MATTLGDVRSSGGPSPMKRQATLSEALAEVERLGAELEQERERARRLDDELREARRLEAVGRLAGGVAHDFSNILAVITGYSELMLKRMDPTDPLRTGAESIRKAAVWGLNLTQHMLTTSRAAAPVPMSLDINAVIGGVVRTLAPLLGDQIQVALDLDPRLGRVRVNMGQVEQTLMNLLLNARDAMPSGGRVTIETGNVDLEQGPTGALRAVMVRITDTGCGMDDATLSRAFEPYFTTKAPGRGTGLGLATVFAFVSQSGGHVEAASEVGQGSTFTVYLPRHDAGDEPPVATPVAAATVLVLEPEPGVRDLIAEILELHGYHVLSARDLDEALAASTGHQGPIDLVIADLLLPGVAGDGVLQRLGPYRASARVLYLSGDFEDSVEDYRGLNPGRGFLHKPFTVDALVQKVREIVGR
ncbi:MAG: hybrid sensor histidine kinase/response regulator [Candidatus Rokuibacteriota bacterium]|nr:MAG: hybrid sensor histidine kinase/response regulator [Candidatus Rokubacteria bacterium]